MELNLKAMMTGDLERLRYIRRFSTFFVMHEESVAEHVFYVSIYCLMIADWCCARGMEIDYATLIIGALSHDLEEARTGDIFRPLKVDHPEVKMALSNASHKEVVKVISPSIGGDERQCTNWYLRWGNAKDEETKEGCIVAFADYLSVLGYVLLEVRASNITMGEHKKTLGEYLKTFNSSSFDFLSPLVEQTIFLFEETFK